MLFRHATLLGIASGEITLAFRRWRRPGVRAGTRLRTALGVVVVERVATTSLAAIRDADARRAGYADQAELARELARHGAGELYRIELSHGGADPRIALRSRTRLSADERAALERRLARLDAASRSGPWTARVLQAIAERPGVRAAELAQSFGRETLPFKRDVRKLKELGLTESLEVGYRLSARGQSFVRTSRVR